MLAAFVSIAAAEQPGAAARYKSVPAKDMMEATGVVKQMDGMVAAMGQGFRKGAADASGAAKAEAAGEQFDR